MRGPPHHLQSQLLSDRRLRSPQVLKGSDHRRNHPDQFVPVGEDENFKMKNGPDGYQHYWRNLRKAPVVATSEVNH